MKTFDKPYPGMIPMTEPHPNRMPQQLHKLISRKYARLLTFVRTFPSCSDMPGGSALRLFFPFFEGRPFSRVAGTRSKYGSYQAVKLCSWSETVWSCLPPDRNCSEDFL